MKRVRTNPKTSVEIRRVIQQLDREQKTRYERYYEGCGIRPVYFLGDYTDDFLTTDGLTGPYTSGMTGATAAANGELTLTGTDSAAGEMYCGHPGGMFLPGLGTWAIETEITSCDTLYYGAGICATALDFADSITFVGGSGRILLYFLFQTATPTYKITWQAGTSGQVIVAKKPQAGNELYLRIQHSYTSPNHSFVFKYKWTGDGSWTTGATLSYTESTLSWTGKYVDCGSWSYAMNGVTSVTKAEYLTVEYTPSAKPTYKAFVSGVAFSDTRDTYTKNHLYLLQDDGFYKDGEATDDLIVYDVLGQVLRRYDEDADEWVVLRTFPALHAEHHENGGDDEIDVTGLSGLLGDAQTPLQHALQSTTYHSSTGTSGKMVKFTTDGMVADATNTDAEVAAAVSASHARQHALNSTSDHTMTAVENNFLSADASGLPKDSGKSDASYEDAGTVATHAALDTDVHGITSGEGTIESTSGAQTKADAAEAAADTYTDTELATHAALTQSTHGAGSGDTIMTTLMSDPECALVLAQWAEVI